MTAELLVHAATEYVVDSRATAVRRAGADLVAVLAAREAAACEGALGGRLRAAAVQLAADADALVAEPAQRALAGLGPSPM